MADFSTIQARQGNIATAWQVLATIRNAYNSLAAVRNILNEYKAGTNAGLKAGVEDLFSAAQRTELGTVATKFAASVTDLEANHASLIGR